MIFCFAVRVLNNQVQVKHNSFNYFVSVAFASCREEGTTATKYIATFTVNK